MARVLKQYEEKESLRVRDICVIMDVNLRTGYALVHGGHFPVLKLGRTIRIPREPFIKWWKDGAQKKAETRTR